MEEWRTPEKRNMMVAKIAEMISHSPEMRSRNPADIENTIYMKSKNEVEYKHIIGKIYVSLKHRMQTGMNHGAYQPQMPYPAGPQQVHRQVVPNNQYGGFPNTHGMPMHPQPNSFNHNTGMGPSGIPGHVQPGMNPGAVVGHHPHGGNYPPNMGMRSHVMNSGMVRQGVMPGGMMSGQQHGRGMMSSMYPQAPGGPGMVASGPQPGMAVEQHVRAIPNPYNVQDTAIMNRPSGAPSPFTAPGYQGSPGSIVNPPASRSPAPQPPQQAPSPAPKLPLSPRAVNSPSTPWNPNSVAETSPGQPAMPPEVNEAYMRKLQELQKYVPLVARMIDKLNRQQGDSSTKNEHYMKLNSLYSLLTDQSKRVSVQTLEKCERALEKLFEKPQPPTPPAGGGVTSEPPEPPPPLPSTSPLSSASLREFNMAHSPLPLATTLLPTLQPSQDPINRLPPDQRTKLKEQAKHALIYALRREIAHLRNFNIKQISTTELDGSVDLECSLIDDGLPTVPSLSVHIASNYPVTSPECILTSYQEVGASPFVKKVGNLLLDQLVKCAHNYSLTFLLTSWESCVLMATSDIISVEQE